MCHKRRKTNVTKGKGSSTSENKEYQCKEWLDRRTITWKEVRKWTSGIHLELGFLSHNVRAFTHFCSINRRCMR
jgi:hypothetical protein